MGKVWVLRIIKKEVIMFGKEVTDLQRARAKMLENREYVDMNIDDIRKRYGGRWIGVLDKKVVIDADSPEVIKETLKDREEEGVIIRVPTEPIRVPI